MAADPRLLQRRLGGQTLHIEGEPGRLLCLPSEHPFNFRVFKTSNGTEMRLGDLRRGTRGVCKRCLSKHAAKASF